MLNTTDLGIRIVLWIGKIVPMPAPPWFSQALQRVQVDCDDEGKSGFQLTFALSRDTPFDYTGLVAGTLDPFNRVVIGVLVGAELEVLVDGVITHQEFSPSDQPGKTTVTASGADITTMMTLDERRMPHPPVPDSAIVELVLAAYLPYGVVPAVVPTVGQPNPLDVTPWQCGTDLAFIQCLASRNGYVFRVEPQALGVNVAYFGPDTRFGVPQRALTVNMGAATNVVSVRFAHKPLDAFRATGNLLDRSIPLPLPLPLPALPLAYTPPLAASPTLPRRTRYLGCVADAELPRGVAEAQSAMASGRDVVTCDGTLDAVRYGGVLRARRTVGLRGVGFSYDGLYYVKRVTHTLQAGQYTQGFSLAREGLGALLPVVVP